VLHQKRLTLLLFGLLQAPIVFAYVDPNAPGLIFQLLFPLIVMLALARDWVIGVFRKIVAVFRRKR
jgi:hypothetical protein